MGDRYVLFTDTNVRIRCIFTFIMGAGFAGGPRMEVGVAIAAGAGIVFWCWDWWCGPRDGGGRCSLAESPIAMRPGIRHPRNSEADGE